MSFILEALKKADAERDRGAVPDLHAQGMLPEAAFEAEPAGRGRPWVWLLAGVGLAVIAGLAWQRLGPAPASEERAAAPPLPPPLAPPHVPAIAVAPPLPAPKASSAAPVETNRPAQDADSGTAPPTAASAAPEPAASHVGGAQTAPAAARKESPKLPAKARIAAAAADIGAAAPTPKAVPKAVPTASAVSPAAAARRAPLLSELPDDVRRQVPALKLGGLVYSAAPASRMVLVNGDLQREGGIVAPGLKLERIDPKAVIFSLRGQRFEVPL